MWISLVKSDGTASILSSIHSSKAPNLWLLSILWLHTSSKTSLGIKSSANSDFASEGRQWRRRLRWCPPRWLLNALSAIVGSMMGGNERELKCIKSSQYIYTWKIGWATARMHRRGMCSVPWGSQNHLVKCYNWSAITEWVFHSTCFFYTSRIET